LPHSSQETSSDQTAEALSYWNSFADSFRALGPPLRPSPQDIQAIEQAASVWVAGHPGRGLQALLLGVTPELANMAWPELCTVFAVDSSLAMARAVWPGNIPLRRVVACGNWLALPRADGSCDLVAGDGSINCLSYPEGYRSLAAEVHRVLKGDGVFLLRCYLRPERQERPEELVRRILEFPSFHHFKFSLLTAMQADVREGIAVRRVHQFWTSRQMDGTALPDRPGWEKQAVRTIEFYRGTATVHTFPSLAELRAVLSEYFEEASLTRPSYPMGDRCPTLVLKPRGSR
jgi:SAM-dependent methyltransferase